MSKIDYVTRKSMIIRPSGRSTDFITPSFGYGCLYNCTYCYMKRHKPEGLTIADTKSMLKILTEINSHAWFDTTPKPNQTHEEYVTYDISCNEDFALHAKYHDWEKIFTFFVKHQRAMGSFATKYVNEDLLSFNPANKIRIRFSLMPQVYSDELEPNTSPIYERLLAINYFIEAGYDVHVNFSPVIYEKNWTNAYKELFIQLDHAVKDEYKNKVKAEVIFLTHNEDKHLYNLQHNLPGEELIWKPDLQEDKISQYGGANLRYEHNLKRRLKEMFIDLHDEIIPWNIIRYIF